MINIYFGKTSDDCLVELIKKVKGVKEGHHIFLVPDRMSVLCEKKIFEILNIDSTCNIEVLTLSRLASKILKNRAVVSKAASCMILQKLLKEHREELKCFNKNQDNDLAQTIYGTISQFKSCKISFDEVGVKGKNILLQDKLDDIALLYKEYQQELAKNNLIDSFDKLNFVENEIKNNEFVCASNIYVASFDSFTFQGYEIINALAKYCKEFSIGLPNTDSLQNEHIYNANYKNNILKIFSNYKLNINFCPENRKGTFAFLQDNLFSFSPHSLKVKDCDVSLFECKNFEEEVINCACKIKKYMINGNYKFSDFFVAMPNLQSKADVITRIFEKYNFRFFIDTSQDFSKTIIARLIKNCYELIQEKFSIKSVLSFLKNPIIGLPNDVLDDFEDYSLKYNLDDFYEIEKSKIESCEFYKNFNIVRNFLIQKTNRFREEIANSKTFLDFITAFKNLFEEIGLQEKLNDMILRFVDSGNLKQVKIFEQYYDTLLEIFDSLIEVLGNETTDLKIFYSTLNSGLKSTTISTAPLSINSIFVGDSSVSFYEDKKIGFILGATEQDFPLTNVDCGIISDNDIKDLSECYKLEPSIADINKKERFKVYELLLKPTEKLIMSYNYASGEKSKIMSDISQMFLIEKNSGFNQLEFNSYDELDSFDKNNNLNIAKNNLVSSLRGYCDGQRDLTNFDSTLYNVLKQDLDANFLDRFNFKNNTTLKNNVFFAKNTVSVSQVESFMTCPFLHFIRYGLKLKEKDEGEFDSLNIGLIMHEVAQVLLQNTTLPEKDDIITDKTIKIFDKILDRDEFESLKSSASNKILIKNLRKESVRFTLALNEQARHSAFKPTYFEARFDDNKKIKSLKINIGKKVLSLVGQVDRIDIFNDFFRIIDYKTGSCDTSLKELYFGKKVQLEAYMKVCEKYLKLKPAGVYYLPVKSGFSDEKTTLQAKYQLKGRTLKNWEIIKSSDDRFDSGELKSDIVEIKLRTNDGENSLHSAYSKTGSESSFNNVGNYAIKLIEKACQDISSLNITPSPLVFGSDSPCKNCKYSGVCRFDTNCGNVSRNIQTKVTEEFFEEGDKE